MKSSRFAPVLALAALVPLACDQTGAYGDMDSIIVGTSPDLWEQINEPLISALEPRVFTVRAEKTFQVTFQDPFHEDWRNLREFKQELLIGRATDVWMTEAVAELDEPLAPPQIAQVYDVWARGQNVTLMILSEDGGADEVLGLLDELHQLYDGQFRTFALSRMYVSGRDTALADTLGREAGFSVLLPKVYYWDRQDSVFLFRNDNPDPSELIRQVMVTWRSPATPEIDREGILEWRSEVAATYYGTPQLVDLSVVNERVIEVDQRPGLEVQAVWENPPDLDWPAGGPLITRAVWCPSDERTYLLDAWLYAPGKDKYEYMIQLQTILDSFQCGLSG
jgi:hypothetical protein